MRKGIPWIERGARGGVLKRGFRDERTKHFRKTQIGRPRRCVHGLTGRVGPPASGGNDKPEAGRLPWLEGRGERLTGRNQAGFDLMRGAKAENKDQD